MAFTGQERVRVTEIMDRYIEQKRPPEHLRDQVDLAYRIEDQSVIIFEIRPLWDKPSRKIESPIAKARYVRTQNVWEIFWQRADLKWHFYEPDPDVNSLEEFLEIVEADDYASFWG